MRVVALLAFCGWLFAGVHVYTDKPLIEFKDNDYVCTPQQLHMARDHFKKCYDTPVFKDCYAQYIIEHCEKKGIFK